MVCFAVADIRPSIVIDRFHSSLNGIFSWFRLNTSLLTLPMVNTDRVRGANQPTKFGSGAALTSDVRLMLGTIFRIVRAGNAGFNPLTAFFTQ